MLWLLSRRAVDDLDKALLATGFPSDRRDFTDHFLSYFKAFLIHCQGSRHNGSAALACAMSPAVAT